MVTYVIRLKVKFNFAPNVNGFGLEVKEIRNGAKVAVDATPEFKNPNPNEFNDGK